MYIIFEFRCLYDIFFESIVCFIMLQLAKKIGCEEEDMLKHIEELRTEIGGSLCCGIDNFF